MGEESDYRKQIEMEDMWRKKRGIPYMHADDPYILDFMQALHNLGLMDDFDLQKFKLGMMYV